MQTTSKPNKRARKKSFGEPWYWGVLLISPWLVGLLTFKLVPIIASLVLSFTNFFLLEPKQTQFIGLANYVAVFNDADAKAILLRTINLALLIIPTQVIASILVAGILSSKKLLAKNTIRALFFLPSIIPSVAAVFMWQGFVNPSTGWLNRLILDPLGLGALNRLSGRDANQALFILSTLWMLGPGMLIIAGSMQGIAPEIHEAAKIDGAGRIRRFFAITLPLITPAIFFTIILNLTSVFGGAILLDRGHTFNSDVSSYDNYIYFVLFRLFKLGRASSLAWTFFAFVMGIVMALFLTAKYWVYFPDQEQ